MPDALHTQSPLTVTEEAGIIPFTQAPDTGCLPLTESPQPAWDTFDSGGLCPRDDLD